MNINEVIRRLRIQATAEGVAQTTDALKGLARAQDGVAASATSMANVTDTAARRQLSAASAFERHERRLNLTVRAQREFERVQRDVNLAVAQNPALQARANELMARAAAHYNQAAAAQALFAKASAAANEQAQAMASRLGSAGTLLAGFGPAGLIAAAGIGASTLAIGKMVSMVNELADKGGKMVDFAETTGLATRQIQALNKAGAEVGLTAEKIGQGFERFTVSLEELRNGSGQLFDIMGKINPALRDQLAAAKTTAAAWDVLTMAMERADLTQRNALARAAFGRTGIGMTRLGAASTQAGGLAGLETSVSKFAPSQEDLRRWDELKDRLDYLKSTAGDVFASLFADDLLQAQLRFFEMLLQIAGALKDIKSNEPEWFKALKSLETLGPMQLFKDLKSLETLGPMQLFRGNPFGIFGMSGGTGVGKTGETGQINNFQQGRSGSQGRAVQDLPPDYIAKLEKAARTHQAILAAITAQTREERLLAAEMSRSAELSDSKLSSEEKALEVQRAREQSAARLNEQFESQITSLAQQLELIQARQNGDEASVLSAQAYRNAIRQGADQMQAMSIAALTMRIEMEKASEAALRMEEAASRTKYSLPDSAYNVMGKFTGGRFTTTAPATQFDASYGPGNVTKSVTQQFGILPNQYGRVATFKVDQAATDAFRANEQTAKLQQDVARLLLQGTTPLAIEQQILSGRIGTGTYSNIFGGPSTASASPDAILKIMMDLEKRAGIDPSSTLARIRSGEIGKGASNEALLSAIDELTNAIKSNTSAITLSPFYQGAGTMLGYRSDGQIPGFADGGTIPPGGMAYVGEHGPMPRLLRAGSEPIIVTPDEPNGGKTTVINISAPITISAPASDENAARVTGYQMQQALTRVVRSSIQ